MNDKRDESNGPIMSVRRHTGESGRDTLQRYTDEIIEAELETAYDRLETSEPLSPETIDVISRMATRIGESVMAGPKAALEEASEPDIRGTVADLFDLDVRQEFKTD